MVSELLDPRLCSPRSKTVHFQNGRGLVPGTFNLRERLIFSSFEVRRLSQPFSCTNSAENVKKYDLNDHESFQSNGGILQRLAKVQGGTSSRFNWSWRATRNVWPDVNIL